MRLARVFRLIEENSRQIAALMERMEWAEKQIADLVETVGILSRRVDRYGSRLGVEHERRARILLVDVLRRMGFRLIEPMLAAARG